MKNIKSIILSWIIIIFACLFMFLFLKINSISKALTWEEDTNLINITPTEKTSDIELLQESIKSNINSIQNSIATIYKTQKIWSMVENEDWEPQEQQIETVEKLEWNAIVISNDWYMITNKHVVADTEKSTYKAILQWQEYPIDKIRFDELLDIAILKIKTKESTIPATISTMDKWAEIGDIVFAIKNDTEVWEFITKIWLINSLNQKFEIQNNDNIYVWLIKNSTAIEWGFSWWPLINIKWEVIWINTAVDNIEYSASYALPINQEFINQTISSIKESGRIIRPDLWIEYENEKSYAKVTNILEEGSASETNLEIWDIIVWINSIPVNYNNFMYVLYTYKVWKEITLNINKDWHKKDVQIRLWKH